MPMTNEKRLSQCHGLALLVIELLVNLIVMDVTIGVKFFESWHYQYTLAKVENEHLNHSCRSSTVFAWSIKTLMVSKSIPELGIQSTIPHCHTITNWVKVDDLKLMLQWSRMDSHLPLSWVCIQHTRLAKLIYRIQLIIMHLPLNNDFSVLLMEYVAMLRQSFVLTDGGVRG